MRAPQAPQVRGSVSKIFRTKGLERDDAAGADVRAVKECLEGFQNRGVGGLGQKAESRDAGRSRSMRPRRTRGMEKVQ